MTAPLPAPIASPIAHRAPPVIPLDVDLLNGRGYVQGSQILARLCRLPDVAEAVLVQARFTQLTDRLLAARPPAGAADPAAVGLVEFMRDGQHLRHEIIELAGPAPVAQRPAIAAVEVVDDDGALGGRCRFAGAVGIEGLLDALVQGIKALHQRLPEPTVDIWFTGLRKWALPVDGPAAPLSGTLEVHCLRRGAGRDGRHQSLLRAVLAGDGLVPAEGLVTFAWRTSEAG